MATKVAYGRTRTSVSGEWECDDCGFVRRGSLQNRPKRCPECDAPGDAFSFWSDDEEDEEDWDDDWDDKY